MELVRYRGPEDPGYSAARPLRLVARNNVPISSGGTPMAADAVFIHSELFYREI